MLKSSTTGSAITVTEDNTSPIMTLRLTAVDKTSSLLNRPGDHLIIKPTNPTHDVEIIQKYFHIDNIDEKFVLIDGDKEIQSWRIDLPISYRKIFTESIDLSAPPSQEFLMELQRLSGRCCEFV